MPALDAVALGNRPHDPEKATAVGRDSRRYCPSMNAWSGPGTSNFGPQYSPDGRWFWTGNQWAPVPPPMGQMAPPWKGARFGRPPTGPGSLAEPARRLGARLLDALVFLPVAAIVIVGVILIVAPHLGKLFPTAGSESTNAPTPGFVLLEFALIGASILIGAAFVAYETIATVRYGRTLGKARMHIRIVATDGSPLGWGRALGRTCLYWLSSYIGVIGLVDPLWCLWDNDRQCVHDKAVNTIVVND